MEKQEILKLKLWIFHQLMKMGFSPSWANALSSSVVDQVSAERRPYKEVIADLNDLGRVLTELKMQWK